MAAPCTQGCRKVEAKFSASSTEQVQQQSRVENIAEIVEPSCVTCVRTVCVRRSQVTALELRGLGPFPDKRRAKNPSHCDGRSHSAASDQMIAQKQKQATVLPGFLQSTQFLEHNLS
ncbi:hypothetical protein CpipJ_CPIJ011283 [Culex quinquefasciatus]|uniref:Uncharacterized protein n=1 Tax=Culex quinquefasciatus TaxID=7176 RepID=B0WVZ3_CULQU|nr:hypothetical protein CpipJ_CPIJ011283 [Culex quinquefasciatus]|eukprot:XP_001861565.1 hypothetical protein CpipJ_CPIJ011283 [Culex quinquefasciatus]